MNSLGWFCISTVMLAAIGCGSVVALEIGRPTGVNTNATYTLIGILGPIFAVLIQGIKSHADKQGLAVEVKEVKAAVATPVVPVVAVVDPLKTSGS